MRHEIMDRKISSLSAVDVGWNANRYRVYFTYDPNADTVAGGRDLRSPANRRVVRLNFEVTSTGAPCTTVSGGWLLGCGAGQWPGHPLQVMELHMWGAGVGLAGAADEQAGPTWLPASLTSKCYTTRCWRNRHPVYPWAIHSSQAQYTPERSTPNIHYLQHPYSQHMYPQPNASRQRWAKLTNAP